MHSHDILLRIWGHPWIVAILALTFFGCNFLAWLRIRREEHRDYRRPQLPRS